MLFPYLLQSELPFFFKNSNFQTFIKNHLEKDPKN